MNRIAIALGWEYSRRVILYAIFTTFGVVFLPYLAFNAALGMSRADFESHRFHLPYLGITYCLIGSLILQMHDDMRERLVVKPLSHRSLFGWLVLVPVVIATAAHFLATGLIGIVYDVSWPYIRPAAYLVTMICASVAIRWHCLGRGYLIAAAYLTTATLLLYGSGSLGYTPHGIRQPLVLDAPWSFWEVVGIGSVLLTSLVVASRSLASLRSGGAADRPCEQSVEQSKTEVVKRFQSAQTAMEWLHRNTAKQAMVGCAIVCMLATGLQLLAASQAESPTAIAVEMSILLVIGTSFALGSLMGLSIRLPGEPPKQAMSTFLATKPLSDQGQWYCFGRSLLWGAAGCTVVLVTFGMCLPIAASWIFLQSELQFPESLETLALRCGDRRLAVGLWVGFLFLLMTSGASFVAAAAMMCRDKLVVTLVSTTVAMVVVSFFFFAWCQFPQALERRLVVGVWAIIATGIFGFTAFGVARAWRGHLIGPWSLGLALTVVVLVAVLARSPRSPSDWQSQFTLLTTMVAGLPWAPLALRYARHR